MPIGSTLPAHNLQPYLTRQSGFQSSGSPLNPAAGPPTKTTWKHLSNLEKLLQKQNRSTNPDPDPGKPNRPRGAFLARLDLNRLWPVMKSAEDMSPRHLNRLQLLLSDSSSEYSPRNSLAARWREYHGLDNWTGMLDPLDENLRREIVRYGEFVQAAYHCFHSSPATSSHEYSPHHVVLPDRSYRVTRCLYATASVGLPPWADDVAPGWMTQRTSRVGYVAVCDDPREIQRMGRRDIVIALRGTATCLEWAENFRGQLAPVDGDVASSGKVGRGFLSLFRTHGANEASLAESVADEIRRLTEKYRGEELSVTVTGHSLGAALALLVADEIAGEHNRLPVAVYSFGGPRVGDGGFAERVGSKGVKVLRVANGGDVVTRVPGKAWAYTHVGTELRVETRMSPFLREDADVACCHDLEAYLHLVDGFVDSDGPFRPNAKRSLWKLVKEQRSNMKRLYTTNKANGPPGSSSLVSDVSVV